MLRNFSTLRGCPGWAAPFFDADAGGAAGAEGADAAGAEGAAGGAPGAAAGGEAGAAAGAEAAEAGAGKGGSLLSNAGKEEPEGGGGAPEGDPGEGEGEGEKEKKGGEDGDDDGPVTKDALVIPEGQEWDDEMGAPLLDVINDAAMSAKEKAQKIVDMIPAYQEKILASIYAANEAEGKKTIAALQAEEAAWAKASAADPEFGGDMWKANQGVIARGRDHLATPEVVQVFDDNGLGDHPEILRMFYRAGKLLGEDPTKGSGGGGAAQKSRADRMFGKSLEGLNIKGADDE